MVKFESRKIVADNNVKCIDVVRDCYNYFSYSDNTNSIIFRDWIICLKVYNLYPIAYNDYFIKLITNPFDVIMNNKPDIIDLFNLSIESACKQNCDFMVDTLEFKKLEREENNGK